MRNLIMLITVFLLAIFVQPSYANQEDQNKVLVGFKYYNTSTWGMTTKEVYDKIVSKNVAPILSDKKVEMITDEQYFTKLKSNGYSDFASVERADLVDIYKDDGFRYIILIEVDPVRPAAAMGYESAAHMKIVDMKSSKYLFNGKIPGMTKWGGAGTAVEHIGEDIRKILIEKIASVQN